MLKIPWTHLHAHTELSPDGLGTTDALVNHAARLGFSSLAMTDHGSMGNAITFMQTCHKYGIKPILGLEAYLSWNNQRHHITLNSISRTGFENLILLSNAAHKNWTSGYPIMTVEMLSAMPTDDIVMLSGCPASPIFAGSDVDATNFVATMFELLGKRFYMEIMCVLDGDYVSRPANLAQKLGIPAILTNDVHYTHREYYNVHKILTECRKGYTYDSSNLWMKTPDEMLATARRFFTEEQALGWMRNAYDLAESAERWQMQSEPELTAPTELLDEFVRGLRIKLESDLAGRTEQEKKKRRERFDLEFNAFSSSGFLNYFVALNDIVAFAQRANIVVSARGSAVASFLLFLLGISNVDPLEHGLYFERFFNPSRQELPDVDLDIESDRRNEVLEYAQQRWGGIPIATYSRFSHKSLINDITRVLQINKTAGNRAGEMGTESEEYKHWAALHPDAPSAYNIMSGQIRHAGKHAGGVVITKRIVPIENVSGQLVAAWTEGHERQLSALGIVKYDVLGVAALSQLRMLRELTGTEAPKVPPDNDPVFEIFQKGDVLGIFQWTGSEGIRDLTMKIAPTSFVDLTTINALYRPGALDAGLATSYPALAGRPRLIEPRIDRILAETRGVIVFQEQVMAIFAAVTGISFAEADLIRRLVVKARPEDPKWVLQVQEAEKNFQERGQQNGYAPATLELLWREIMTHTRYSFNRAHAAAYSAIACEMAWYKLYHPLFFYTTAMQYDTGNMQAYLYEAMQKGIGVLLPHVNSPSAKCLAVEEKNAIRLPLSIVKFLGAENAQKIVDEHGKRGPFASLADFRKRVGLRTCTSRACAHLQALGAFDGVEEGHTPRFFEEIEEQEELAGKTTAEKQIEAMGFVLPSKAMIEHIANAGENEVAGFIYDWKDKVGKTGKHYRVYYCQPRGSFWVKDRPNIKKGDFVRVKKNAWGEATERKRIIFEE
jgi:DNA polymerase-3 subunit alpha